MFDITTVVMNNVMFNIIGATTTGLSLQFAGHWEQWNGFYQEQLYHLDVFHREN